MCAHRDIEEGTHVKCANTRARSTDLRAESVSVSWVALLLTISSYSFSAAGLSPLVHVLRLCVCSAWSFMEAKETAGAFNALACQSICEPSVGAKNPLFYGYSQLPLPQPPGPRSGAITETSMSIISFGPDVVFGFKQVQTPKVKPDVPTRTTSPYFL